MLSRQRDCQPGFDREFGPAVACRDFDLTLAFEQSILDIGVSGLFIIITFLYVLKLISFPERTTRSPIYFAKAVCSLPSYHLDPLLLTKQGLSIGNVAVRLACLILWHKNPITAYSVAGSSVTVISSIAIVVLLLVGHTKSIRPSSLISVYLLSRITADAVQLRTLELRNYAPSISRTLSAGLGIQLLFLVLESWPRKRSIKDFTSYSPQDTAGVFNRSILWWMNTLFMQGSKSILQQSDLFNLDFHLQSSRLRSEVLLIWNKSQPLFFIPKEAVQLILLDQFRKHALLKTIFSCLFVSWLRIAPSRICSIALKYSQTFLLDEAVSYLAKPAALRDRSDAYGMIGAAALIYVGMGVCSFLTVIISNKR
jgi:ATP-binding cassette subfamily C (CFTR/MRP) protein 1